MNDNDLLYWHPRFRVYRLDNNDILLNQSHDSHLFKANDFPTLQFLDGETETCEIFRHCNTTREKEKTTRLFTALIQENFIVNIRSENIPEYYSPFIQLHGESIDTKSVYLDKQNTITNLSSLDSKTLNQWVELLEKLKTNDKYFSENFSNIILVDDFLDTRIAQLIKRHTNYWVIKVSGESLWFSPISSEENSLDWNNFRKRLLHNQPTLNLLFKLQENTRHVFPIENRPCLDEVEQEEIGRIICSYFKKTTTIHDHHLTIYDRKLRKATQHPVKLPRNFDQPNSALEKIQVLKLESRLVNFDEDGGCRTTPPTETVSQLLSLVSPITGVITHLEKITDASKKQIAIFSSAFYKPINEDVSTVQASETTLSNRRFVQTCLGKGASEIQSKASALSEAIERLAAHYHGNEMSYVCESKDLKQRFYTYQEISPYSTTQYKEFTTSPNKLLVKQQAEAYGNSPINWSETWSLTKNEAVFVPQSLCYENTPTNDKRFGQWNSNGCAAGNNKEEAILQALFELIERDATAIWWYNKVTCPSFSIDKLPASIVESIDETIGQEHHYWLLDLTHDLQVPVVAAIAKHKINGGYSLGFGCHLSPKLAGQRALTELCQLIPIRNQKNTIFNFDAIKTDAFLYPDEQRSNAYEQVKPNIEKSIQDDILSMIQTIVGRLEEKNIETLVLDYNRPELLLSTVKVIAPGLCHIWPQLANERLYMTPYELGWVPACKTEEELNSLPLYI